MPLQEVAASDARSLQELADLLVSSHKVLIITGAGISTSCGIPDFRSKEGLYNMIPELFLPTPPSSQPPSQPATPRKWKRSGTEDDDLPPSSQSSTASGRSRRSSTPGPKLKGQDLFDSNIWKSTAATEMFYQTIASLRRTIREEVTDTSATHKFIRTLRDGGRLMRCYTQNIDGLEAREGLCMDMSRGRGNRRRFMKKHYETPLPEDRINTDFDGGCEVVALHGDLEQLRCTLCQGTYEWTASASEIFLSGHAPRCEECNTKSDQRQATGKRGLAVGSLRPNIVLYGEDHPSNHLLSPLVPFDVASGPEVLLIIGTSLKVFGLQKVVREFAKAVHGKNDGKGRVIFVNRTKPAESSWDGIIDDYVAMDCDDWVEDLHNRRPDLWLRQGELDLKMTKPTKTATKRKRKADDENKDEQKPTKKTKVAVEIPQRNNIKNSHHLLHASDEELRERATGPTAQGNELATPRKSKSWKKNVFDNPVSTLLSPLVQQKPPHSALKRAFKPYVLADMEAVPDTPKRPEWSPIRPDSPLKIEVGQEVEIGESDHEKENNEPDNRLPVIDDIDVETPSKTRVRHLSGEAEKVRKWTIDSPLGKLSMASTSP